MTEERQPDAVIDTPTEALEEWREAERDEAREEPGSAAKRMAHQRSDAAKEHYHEAEDDERERQGNHRPRKEPQV